MNTFFNLHIISKSFIFNLKYYVFFILLFFLFIYPINAYSERYVVLFIHGLCSGEETWNDLFSQFYGSNILGHEYHPYHLYAYLNDKDDVILQENSAYFNMLNTLSDINDYNPKRLVKAKYYTLTMMEYPYGNVGGFDNISFKNQGRLIKKAVDYLLEYNGAQKAILVGHSMGGLAIYSYLKNKSENGIDKTLQVFTIGTPYKGSNLAYAGAVDYINILSIIFKEINLENISIKNLRPSSQELYELDLEKVVFQDVYTVGCDWNFKQSNEFLVNIYSYIHENDWREIFDGKSADGVVSLDSQLNKQNGLKSNKWKEKVISGDVFHIDETSNDEIQKLIKEKIDGLFQIGNGLPSRAIREAFQEAYENISN